MTILLATANRSGAFGVSRRRTLTAIGAIAVLVGGQLSGRIPLSAQQADVATLSVAEQEALAERYRANLLLTVSPDDWYQCYNDPKLSDFEQPMYAGMLQAVRRAGLSDAQLKPFLQKEVFNRFVWLLWIRQGGVTNIPREALYNCHNRPVPPAARNEAGRRLLSGLTKFLGAIMGAAIGSDAGFVADRLLNEAPAGASDAFERSDVELDAASRQGLLAMKAVVGAQISEQAATTFLTDAPGVQAQGAVRAAAALVDKREWPNAFFLMMTNGVSGAGAGFFELANFYGGYDHADVKAYNGMTEYQKGGALRRMLREQMRLMGEIASGRLTPEEYAKGRNVERIPSWRPVIVEAFGLAVFERYEEAVRTSDQTAAPQYRAQQIRSAAYAYIAALRTIMMLST